MFEMKSKVEIKMICLISIEKGALSLKLFLSSQKKKFFSFIKNAHFTFGKKKKEIESIFLLGIIMKEYMTY